MRSAAFWRPTVRASTADQPRKTWRLRPSIAGVVLARAITLLAVVLAWVFFRSPSLGHATELIRSNEGEGHHVPIIAMTAGARREDRDRCLAAGMNDYVSKPVNKDALIAVLAQWIDTAAHARA